MTSMSDDDAATVFEPPFTILRFFMSIIFRIAIVDFADAIRRYRRAFDAISTSSIRFCLFLR